MECGNIIEEMVSAAQKEAAVVANKVFKSHDLTREERDDLEQDFITAVIEKAECFDPERASVCTFVGVVIRSKMLTELRRRKRESARCNTINCLYDEVIDGDEVVPFHETLDRSQCLSRMGRDEADPFVLSDLIHDVGVALGLLEPRQKQIANHLRESDKTATAARLNISRQTIYREITEIRNVMGDLGLQGYMGTV